MAPQEFAGKENQGGHSGQGTVQGEQKGKSGQAGGNKGGQIRVNGMGQGADQRQQISFAFA